MSRLLLPLLLLSSTLSQDISFPSSGQDDPEHDSEFLQAQHSIPEGSTMHQPMTEYHPGGFGASGGFSAPPQGGEVSGVAAGVMDVGLAIHRVARNEGKQQWWVYSPTSIASALYMVLLGANGKTYTELARLLGVNSISSSLKPHEDFSSTLRNLQYTGNVNNVVKLANGMFVQNDFSIRPDYRDTISSLYQAGVQSLDFRHDAAHARNVINSWVSDNTLGKITEILSEAPPPETKIVLTSSLYFKGEWASPFPTELTKLQNFYPNGRSQPTKLKIPMMATMGTYRYYHDNHLNCEIVGIPYKGETIIFYLILPHNSNKDKLTTLENHLTNSEIERLSENAVLTSDVIVAVPKMKLSSDYQLDSVLQELGLRSLFDPKEADLSLISSAVSQPRPQPGPFEDEDRFVFTRMKKLNGTGEERTRRYIDGFGRSENSRDIRNEEIYSGRSLEGENSGRYFPYPGLSNRNHAIFSDKSNSRKKRQIKLEHHSNSQSLLPSGRNENSLDPGRHLRTLGNPGLYVNQVRHKVVVDINEKGTEAAATTAVSMSKTVSHTVKADAPFMFFIRHEPTKLVLFWGSVVTPPVGG